MWTRRIALPAALVLVSVPAVACGMDSAQRASPERLVQLAQAQDSARPARGPELQTSVPNAAPPASPSQTTASTGQGPVVNQMNDEAAQKVEKEGK